jgi:hypothetical protein
MAEPSLVFNGLMRRNISVKRIERATKGIGG